MDIPASCNDWTNQLNSGTARHRQVLDNVREDPCVDDLISAEFFSRLASSGKPANAHQAIQQAGQVVYSDVERFTCTGSEVPDNVFVTLFRIEDVGRLRYRVPDALDALGLTDSDLVAGNASDDDSRELTDDYDGPVNLGNVLKIVWVSDYNDVNSSLNDLESVLEALGISDASSVTKCVICVYKRSVIGTTLHVPRVLDAMGTAEFQPNKDCSATAGITRPLSGSSGVGMREAVHRSCRIVPDRWELKVVA